MVRKPALKVGQDVSLSGNAVATLEGEFGQTLVASTVHGWSIHVTIPLDHVTRLEPTTEGISEGEPLRLHATVTRVNPDSDWVSVKFKGTTVIATTRAEYVTSS